MLPEQYHWIIEQFEPEGDPWILLEIARELEETGFREGAASVLDRAFGIDPTLEPIRLTRARLLDQLAVVDRGIRFRYVPAGPFLMGSRDGEPDEQPLHPVWLGPYWLSQTPVSWYSYCQLMNWPAPPSGPGTNEGVDDSTRFFLWNGHRIRLQYCEDRTTRARDWHAHDPSMQVTGPGGQVQPGSTVFGTPQRSDVDAPWTYATKPMLAVSWQEASSLADRLTTPGVRYSLPTEAQWEKGARGGLIGARYPWGDEAPSDLNCDFGRFHGFAVKPMDSFPPNGYGLFAMSGGVWEWTSDWYHRDGYHASSDRDPTGPEDGREKVLRGGSWADCAEVLTVTFRMSRPVPKHGEELRGTAPTPTIGFRLCRTVPSAPKS